VYLDIAHEEEVAITWILETHRNEDYVIGSRELKHYVPDARIGHSDATKFEYGESLADGEDLQVGAMKVECINTPGHTPDSMVYAVSDTSTSDDPIVAFTGDTLFVNETGRTDLVDQDRTAEFARVLYSSIHDKVLPLGDGVIIHPAHGAGSVCGGAIGAREISTIGYEKSNNIWLSMDEDQFVEEKLSQELILSPYFSRCERLNTKGPPLLAEMEEPKSLTVDAFEKILDIEGNVVIDTRSPNQFVKGHISSSISLDLDHMGLFVGWVLEEDQRFAYVLQNNADFDRASAMLYRVGLDNIIGYLATGYPGWEKKGKDIETTHNYDIEEFKRLVDEGAVKVLDVRQPHEYTGEGFPGARPIPLSNFIHRMDELKKSESYATLCPSGIRSLTAASLLQRAGFDHVGIPLEGMIGWNKKGYSAE
jgi:hydroxyacylglutathione hydrolase